MAQSAVLTVAEAQQSAVNHGHYVYIGCRYMLSMHSIDICGVCMYAYAPFCDQETFELRMYLLYTYIHICNLLHATPPSACRCCMYLYPIVLGYWPCRPCLCVCARVRVLYRSICRGDQTMVWDKFHDGYQPVVVLPFILCVCRGASWNQQCGKTR